MEKQFKLSFEVYQLGTSQSKHGMFCVPVCTFKITRYCTRRTNDIELELPDAGDTVQRHALCHGVTSI